MPESHQEVLFVCFTVQKLVLRVFFSFQLMSFIYLLFKLFVLLVSGVENNVIVKHLYFVCLT